MKALIEKWLFTRLSVDYVFKINTVAFLYFGSEREGLTLAP